MALEEGFLDAATAPAGRLPGADGFLDWLAAGRHAGMAYMERRPEERCDPTVKFPWAESVMVVALGYSQPEPADLPAQHPLYGLASYAWGRDYHRVMARKLKRLAARLRSEPDLGVTRTWFYSGAGPVLECSWAQAAGMGWIGKNSLLVHPRHGSRLFIGEIFLDIPVSKPEQVADRCGTCTKCIDACPTGAILDNRTVDANRCISYWTIETRDEPPAELAEKFGLWWFGCDICQKVCPWNTGHKAPLSENDLRLRPEYLELDLDGLAAMSRDDFDKVFRASPVRRAGLSKLRRSAAAAAERLRKSK